MNILFNNVDFGSNSGPNGFALKLAKQLIDHGHSICNENPEVVLNFIQGHYKNVPNVLRLDGIYFNTAQDWKSCNKPIQASYDLAEAVVVQSDFNKQLVTKYFGKHRNIEVIHNGTNTQAINEIAPLINDTNKSKRWLAASSWRPHKRLSENIRYFLEHADGESSMYVAGSGDVSAVTDCNDPRVKYVGELTWLQLVALMKSCENFLHLAFLDHCPNVVVDARAAGCHVVCADSGGTSEIAGENSTVLKDEDWDYSPIELYAPPKLDFSNKYNNKFTNTIDIESVCKKYVDVFNSLV